ncbi:MAG: alpha/beta hydrolase [Aureliella sp.]
MLNLRYGRQRTFFAMRPKCALAIVAMMSVVAPCLGQRIQSPQVHQDGSVTFRFQSSSASQVEVRIARVPGVARVALEKGEQGLWEATSPALPAGIHEYHFLVDGTRAIDPHNRWIKKWYSLDSLVEVPGTPALVTELQSVPHGTLHHHTYQSAVIDGDRSAIVYTPPGYARELDRVYPVLFLLHGFGDDQTAWTEVGRAHLIADNLLAANKIAPMVIVMPYGHPEPLPYGERANDYGEKNDAKMAEDLISELLPLIESTYRVRKDRDARGIVGLSMGGGHSLRTGLGHADQFAWVGAFSAAAPSGKNLLEQFPQLAGDQFPRKLLWIACGDKDFLLKRNQQFVAGLKDAGVDHEYVESKGSHNWSVWRDEYLPQFLQLVFQSK